jgi:ADP-ribose pyrophosphatase YjhB (NUDIX family)
MALKVAYGGVVFDDDGRVLLREPKNHFDGYFWTFPKGRPNHRESPEKAALREVLEESGVEAKIIGQLPGSFKGGTTENFYYLMRPVTTGHPLDDETERVWWATHEEAKNLIAQTTNLTGRRRDLEVLEAAVLAFSNPKDLPIIELDLDQLCMVTLVWKSYACSITGQSFSYSVEPLKDAVLSAGENLDGFLTRRIAMGMKQKPTKRKVLFWYAVSAEDVLLTVTDIGFKTKCGWLKEIPGCYQSGKSPIQKTASPFIYWDGKSLHRVHPIPEMAEPDDAFGEGPSGQNRFLVLDMGGVLGVVVTRTNEQSYMEIKNNRAAHWDYSVVPESGEETFSDAGKDYTVRHAFFKLAGETALELS